jgi:hypothetical protein
MDEAKPNPQSSGIRPALLQAWYELLDVDTVTSSSNFYAEGGTSLVAARLLARMLENGFSASLAELISCGTFGEQLEVFAEGPPDASDTRGSRLTMRQELRLKQIARQVKTSGVADVKPVALVLEITGEIDRELLVRSMVDLVRRHDALTLGFVGHQGDITLTQTAFADQWEPEQIDFSGLSIEDARARIWQLISSIAGKGLAFDITSLITGVIATLRPDVTLAAIVVDHLVCDAASLDVLFNDLADIYTARSNGQSPSLPALESTAQDVLVKASGGRVREWPNLAAKWRSLVEGYPAPPAFDLLGTLGGRDYNLTIPSPARAETFHVPAEAATALRAAYRQLALPPLSIMLGATYLASHIMSGEKDICVINPQSRRHAVGAMHVVNDFTEPLIIRIQHSGSSCPCRLTLAEVAALASASHARASALDMPFDMIMRAIKHDGDDPFAMTGGRSVEQRAEPDHDGGRLADHLHRAQAPDEVVPWMWCNYMASGPGSRRMGEAVATTLDEPIAGLLDVPNLEIYIEDDGTRIRVSVIAPEKLYEAHVISDLGSLLCRILALYGESPHSRMSAGDATLCRA